MSKPYGYQQSVSHGQTLSYAQYIEAWALVLQLMPCAEEGLAMHWGDN